MHLAGRWIGRSLLLFYMEGVLQKENEYEFSLSDSSLSDYQSSSDGSTSDTDASDTYQNVENVLVELSSDEKKDQNKLQDIYDDGCSCKTKNCFQQFSFDKFRYAVFSCRELTHEQLDMVLLGIIQSQDEVCHNYTFSGLKICKYTFCKLYAISDKKLRALRKWYAENGSTSWHNFYIF